MKEQNISIDINQMNADQLRTFADLLSGMGKVSEYKQVNDCLAYIGCWMTADEAKAYYEKFCADKERKITVPCNAVIKRHYRCFVEVPESASDDEITEKACTMIVEQQDDALVDDPDIEIEKCDISIYQIDHEGEWTSN